MRSKKIEKFLLFWLILIRLSSFFFAQNEKKRRGERKGKRENLWEQWENEIKKENDILYLDISYRLCLYNN